MQKQKTYYMQGPPWCYYLPACDAFCRKHSSAHAKTFHAFLKDQQMQSLLLALPLCVIMLLLLLLTGCKCIRKHTALHKPILRMYTEAHGNCKTQVAATQTTDLKKGSLSDDMCTLLQHACYFD